MVLSIRSSRSSRAASGTVDKVDKWGVRKLAYRLQKYNEGIYVLVQFSSLPDLVKEVERRMRVADHGDEIHHGPHRCQAEEGRKAEEGAR